MCCLGGDLCLSGGPSRCREFSQWCRDQVVSRLALWRICLVFCGVKLGYGRWRFAFKGLESACGVFSLNGPCGSEDVVQCSQSIIISHKLSCGLSYFMFQRQRIVQFQRLGKIIYFSFFFGREW